MARRFSDFGLVSEHSSIRDSVDVFFHMQNLAFIALPGPKIQYGWLLTGVSPPPQDPEVRLEGRETSVFH